MYKGIKISEFDLIFETVWISVMVLAVLIVIGVLFYYTLTMINRKNIKNLKKLKDRADTDEIAKKRLEKINRKNKKKKEKAKKDRVLNAIFWSLVASVVIFACVYGIIPGWIDYIKKDYVVYSGDFTIQITTRRTYITLKDGTVLYGNAGFDDEDTQCTIVYSKRTHIVLGGEKN